MHLYLHIPFCKKACHYCDFHFSTNLKLKNELIAAILIELKKQSNFLKEKELTTIYFGGGSPSILDNSDLKSIFNGIQEVFSIAKDAEITLEANPDDIKPEKLDTWKEIGINRLSIGIQTFDEEQLLYLNRAHNSKEALDCVALSQKAGFKDLSIDLIYAIASNSHEIWQRNLEIVGELNTNHLSAYALTIEKNTVFGHRLQKKQMNEINDHFAAEQFEMMLDRLEKLGYEQYEISNFAKKGHYAKHNTSYWKGDEYLGIGPSAHSFNGTNRQWNVSNNAKYIKLLSASKPWFENEELSPKDQINELLMTGLRTKWGVDLAQINSITPKFLVMAEKPIQQLILEGKLIKSEQSLLLTSKGKLYADGIASDLFWV